MFSPQDQKFIEKLRANGHEDLGEIKSKLNEARARKGLPPVEGDIQGTLGNLGLGVTKALASPGLLAGQLSRLAPGDQSADPNSFYNRYNDAYSGVFSPKTGVADRSGFNVESGATKVADFATSVALTAPISAGVGALTKLGLKGVESLAPSLVSKALPYVTAPTKASNLANFVKFGMFEGAKDTAIYDTLTTGKPDLVNTAIGVATGGLLGGATSKIFKYMGNGTSTVLNKSAKGSYTESLASGASGIFEDAKGMVKGIVSPYTSKIDEVSGIMSAIKPKQSVKNGMVTRSNIQINEEIKTANNLIRKSGTKPTSIAEYNSAIKAEMQKIGSQIEAKTKQSININLTSTAKKLEDLSKSPALVRIDPQGARELANMANRMRIKQGFLKVEDAEFMNQFINDELHNVASASETRKKGLQIIVGDLREKLDESLSLIPGEFKSLKKQYGALRNIYRDGLSREIVYNRANPEGLISSYSKIEGASDFMSGIMKIAGLDVKGGVSEIAKGLTKNKLGQIIKTKNDPNYIINKIFND